jgi:hypothetical protein
MRASHNRPQQPTNTNLAIDVGMDYFPDDIPETYYPDELARIRKKLDAPVTMCVPETARPIDNAQLSAEIAATGALILAQIITTG